MREAIGLLVFATLVFIHYKTVKKNKLITYYFPALGVKLLAGIAVGLIYTYYYDGGDTWSYFNQAKLISEKAFLDRASFYNFFIKSNYTAFDGFAYPTQPRAAFMVKLVALINVITHTNYWLTSLFFSFTSFIGIYKFAHWIMHQFNDAKIAALSLFVWPSFVLWSSGILKESLAVGLIFWVIPTFFKAINKKNIYLFASVLFGLIALFMIKYYYAIVLTVVLVIYGLSKLLNVDKKNLLTQAVSWFMMLIIGFIIGGLFHPNLRLDTIIGVMMENNLAFLAKSDAASTISFWSAKNEWLWLLVNSPKALFASLFMPLIPEKNGEFYLLTIVENWILMFLFLRALFRVQWAYVQAKFDLILASTSYIAMLAIFLALSTPNLGTLARYKVAFIPIMLVLIVQANHPVLYHRLNNR